MKALVIRLSAYGDVALTAVRVVLGLILAYHGWGKVTGDYAVGFFGNVGIPLPQVLGPLVSILELLGGVALVAGLFTRYLGVIFTLQFLVVAYVRWIVLERGWGGNELELLILFVAVLLATNGGGTLSVDRIVRRWEP